MNSDDLIKTIDSKIAELNKNENNKQSVVEISMNKNKRFKVDLSSVEEFRSVTQWCLDLVKYWTNKDIPQIISLFDNNVIYFETPKDLINPHELSDIWSEINHQNIISLNYEIIDIFKKHNFVDFVLETDKEICYMTYVFVLNEENKCSYFMQQYTIKQK